MNIPDFTQPGAPAPIRHFVRTISPGQTESIDVLGCAVVVKEAEYSLQLGFDDNGDFLDWDLAIGADFQKYGYTFKKLKIKNSGSASNRVEIYAGFFDLQDRRLNIVESRNGSAASEIPTGFSESSLTFVNTNAVQLVPIDYNRCEIWMTADTFGTAWFGADESTMNGASGTADFRRVGLSFDGFTKIKTKAPVWVRGNVGATVRYFLHTY
jgi:hypothetical protein